MLPNYAAWVAALPPRRPAAPLPAAPSPSLDTCRSGDLSAAALGETELCLAFDLDAAARFGEELAAALEAGERGALPGRPELQDVFSFLPTREYGLRFVVNGDFQVRRP
jgi:hypothetical protein